jgi:putative copper export protein
MQHLFAFVKVQPDNLAFFKYYLLQPASSQVDKAEVTVFKSTSIELSLAAITLHKMAALKCNIIKNTLF